MRVFNEHYTMGKQQGLFPDSTTSSAAGRSTIQLFPATSPSDIARSTDPLFTTTAYSKATRIKGHLQFRPILTTANTQRPTANVLEIKKVPRQGRFGSSRPISMISV